MDRIRLLAKDPHWTFVWWELSEAVLDRIAPGATDPAAAQFCLRVHDITDIIFDGRNSHSHFDVALLPGADRWYLRIPVCNRVYCVEIGVMLPGGKFVATARSNPLYLPRDGPAECNDERWSTITL